MKRSEDDLVEAWTAYYEADSEARQLDDNPNRWASESLMLLELREPQRTLSLIVKIASRSSNRDVLGALAAGPLESILARHGEQVIDAVEKLVADDPKFKCIIGDVWRNAMTDAIWQRVLTLQESRP
jgi:hypothetical protein